jgi:hypothetical protein
LELFGAKLTGVQKVVPNKRPGEPPQDVFIQMAIIRLKRFECDVLISLNTELSSLANTESADVTMAPSAEGLLPGADPGKQSSVE